MLLLLLLLMLLVLMILSSRGVGALFIPSRRRTARQLGATFQEALHHDAFVGIRLTKFRAWCLPLFAFISHVRGLAFVLNHGTEMVCVALRGNACHVSPAHAVKSVRTDVGPFKSLRRTQPRV